MLPPQKYAAVSWTKQQEQLLLAQIVTKKSGSNKHFTESTNDMHDFVNAPVWQYVKTKSHYAYRIYIYIYFNGLPIICQSYFSISTYIK